VKFNDDRLWIVKALVLTRTTTTRTMLVAIGDHFWVEQFIDYTVGSRHLILQNSSVTSITLLGFVCDVTFLWRHSSSSSSSMTKAIAYTAADTLLLLLLWCHRQAVTERSDVEACITQTASTSETIFNFLLNWPYLLEFCFQRKLCKTDAIPDINRQHFITEALDRNVTDKPVYVVWFPLR